MNRITALAATAAIAAGAALAASSPATAEPGSVPASTVQLRADNLVPALADTRSAGHFQFLASGLHIWTTDATSQAKVAQYWAMGGSLPGRAGSTWDGTQPQPGLQIVFDASPGSGDDFNILVGEPVYGVDADGFYTDWWLTGGSSAYAASRCPQVTGGSGSGCHGSLAEWQAALPGATVLAGGFSLGSGVKGDGTLHAVQYDDVVYGFTNAPVNVIPTRVDTADSVTFRDSAKAKRVVRLLAAAAPLAAGTQQGDTAGYVVLVDGVEVAQFRLSAGEEQVLKYRFKRHTGRHTVEVLGLQGEGLVHRFVARTGR